MFLLECCIILLYTIIVYHKYKLKLEQKKKQKEKFGHARTDMKMFESASSHNLISYLSI